MEFCEDDVLSTSLFPVGLVEAKIIQVVQTNP